MNFRRGRAPGRLAKLESLWEDGVLMGYQSAGGETTVGTKRAVLRTRTAQRKPKEKRRSPKKLEVVGGTPWRTK